MSLRCTQVEIVYDLFHVVVNYGTEVIDRVCVDRVNQLRHDKPARRVVKSPRWLLPRNKDNLSHAQGVHFSEVLQANAPLMRWPISSGMNLSGYGSTVEPSVHKKLWFGVVAKSGQTKWNCSTEIACAAT